MSCLVLGLALTSCEREAIIPNLDKTSDLIESRSDEPTLTSEGLYHFNDPEAFERYMKRVEKNEKEELNSFNQRNNFQSLKNNPALDRNGILLEDVTFSSILNKEAAISIGNYTFKLNPATEEVYVIKTTANPLGRSAMLRARTSERLSSEVKVFSFEDDVFGLIPDIITCPTCPDVDIDPTIFGCDAAGPGNSPTPPDSCTVNLGGGAFCTFNGTTTVRYFRAGIWFRLSARFWHGPFLECPARNVIDNRELGTTFTLNIDGVWNRCGSGGEGEDIRAFPPMTASRFVHPLYGGTRRLKTFELSAWTTYNCGEGLVGPIFPRTTDVATISSED